MATEEPPFKASLQEGAFEVRDYPALVVAEVTVGGDRGAASYAGFRLLAGYIFGGNTRRQSIAMTAPVVQSASGSETIAMTAPVLQSGNSGAWSMRFIMPVGSTLESLPVPNDQRVHLLALPPTRQAVVRFSGLANEGDIVKKTAELMAFVAAHQLPVTGPASLARYNPPWTLWFLRRNEVMLPLALATETSRPSADGVTTPVEQSNR
ncbi:MAG: heme-binding protein [Proteobacteria bacterium]|nr:heme-binding protein [Pseudomonadota bacterium]